MAKVTLVFALLLVVLGLVSYIGTGSLHPTALIPTWFGIALGIGGFLLVLFETSVAKMRVFRVPDFLGIALMLGLLGMLLLFVSRSF